MLKYMLDTDMCIFTITRKPAHIKRMFNTHIGQLCISAVTWGELICGAEKSASRQFGQVKAELELQGQKIGSYDAMIAGHARSQGLIVVTNNVREFKRVEGVRIVNWLEQA